jgi:hypothetical protein
MESIRTIEKETENFVNACKEIHALLACGPLPTEDRARIISTANELLSELKA